MTFLRNEQELNKKANQLVNSMIGTKHFSSIYMDYLMLLIDSNTYIEADQNGEKYLAVRSIDTISGHGRSLGISIYTSGYWSLVKREDIRNEWLDILNKLSTNEDKLYILGNHGQRKEIDHEWLVKEFIKVHLN